MHTGRDQNRLYLMPHRVVFVQLITGHQIDQGPAWISVVRFNRTWKTAQWHGKTLRRARGMFDTNFYDDDTDEEYWVSGTHRTSATPDTAPSGRPSTMTPVAPTRPFWLVPQSPVENMAERPLMPCGGRIRSSDFPASRLSVVVATGGDADLVAGDLGQAGARR